MTNSQNFEKQTTIIIPSREFDALLTKCINKIRELYKSIKIIIILDEINEETNTGIENILIIKSKNRNMSAKRNLGVSYAETEYIAFLDSDAYPNKNWLENGINFLELNKEYSAITGTQFNPPTDNFTQRCLRIVRYSPLFTHKEWCIIIDKNAKEQDCDVLITSNVIMRKEDYERVNGMDENIYLAEDNEFSERIIKQGYKIRFIPKASVYHRESKMYPFLRKIYCMSYYYANTLIKGKPVKTIKQSIFQLFPLLGIISFLLLWFLFQQSKYLLFLPIFVFLILVLEAKKEAKKLEEQQFKGFFIILFTFCMFCAIWVVGSFLGLINFPSKSIQECYKH